jgi:integrase
MESTIEKPKQKRSTKRRGNGEGSIYQRGDGRWCAGIVTGRDQHGKQLRKVVYGWTKTEVQKKLTKLMPQQQAGTLGNADRITLGEFIDKWLANSVRPNNRASTHASYDQVARLHIKPFIGGIQLSKLMPANVATLYATLEREGRKARLRQMAHAILHRALQYGVEQEILTRNVCDVAERPQAPRKEVTPLTAEQAQAFLLATADHRLYAMFLLAIDAGMRQGELNGLQWDDVDLTAGAVTIRRAVVQIKEEFIVNEPKTARGRRRVEICPATVDALRLHKARMMQEGRLAAGWVFVSKTGQHLRRNAIRKTFQGILRRAGLPVVKFHDLRHTCATLLMASGTHAKVVQERLGHSQISVTLDTYSHVTPTMQREAANTMQGILQATGS